MFSPPLRVFVLNGNSIYLLYVHPRQFVYSLTTVQLNPLLVYSVVPVDFSRIRTEIALVDGQNFGHKSAILRYFLKKLDQPRLFFVYVRSFHTQILQDKNCRLQWDSNLDHQTRGRARWPLEHHHHGPELDISLSSRRLIDHWKEQKIVQLVAPLSTFQFVDFSFYPTEKCPLFFCADDQLCLSCCSVINKERTKAERKWEREKELPAAAKEGTMLDSTFPFLLIWRGL